jgi:glycosyltransferase involved in cell wall biosynthesis
LAPGLNVYTFLQIPWHRFALVRWVNARLILWSARRLIRRHAIRKPIIWFTIPHVATLVGRLGESLSVYYCVDDYASLPGVDSATVRSMDDMMTAKADLVFAVSEKLAAVKACVNPHTHYSPHGVDLENFGRAQDRDLPVPDDIQKLAQPIIGFFGLMEGRFDLDLIAYLATERPHWNFLLIGHVGGRFDRLPKLDNVHFLGKRPYDRLPNYGRQFAAAIIPYKVSQQALYGNPMKLREYLAMGKPVVSIGSPEAEKFADVVEIAHSREDFLVKLDKVVAQPETPESVRRRLDRVAALSWEARIAEVIETVGAALTTASEAPAAETGE